MERSWCLMAIRDTEDHIAWLLQHGWHEKALAVVESGQGRSELLDEVFKFILIQFLNFLWLLELDVQKYTIKDNCEAHNWNKGVLVCIQNYGGTCLCWFHNVKASQLFCFSWSFSPHDPRYRVCFIFLIDILWSSQESVCGFADFGW